MSDGTASAEEVKGLDRVIQIDEAKIRSHLDQVVRGTVTGRCRPPPAGLQFHFAPCGSHAHSYRQPQPISLASTGVNRS